jgi:hypothetical protein
MRARHLLELDRLLLSAAAIACAMASSTTHAAPGAKPPILVFESHVGPRSPDADGLLAPLRDALESYGFAARPEHILKVAGGHVPRPGIIDTGITAAAIAQRVDDGYLDYTKGNYEPAARTLAEAIKLIQRNPGVLALDTGNSMVVFKAYVSLANSHARLGHAAEAVAAMTELIRMYPSVPVTRAHYGPEAEHIYRAVWKQVRQMGRGQLAITAGNPQATIFVDNQIRGIGTASLGDLIPGLYRVLVHLPGTAGRQYEVEVRPSDDSALDVAWSIDSSLHVGESWIGFQLAAEAERGREAALAGALARRWHAGDVVAVVSMTRLQGKPALIGTLYRTDGKVLQSALVSLDVADADRLRALAQFLAEGTPSAAITILTSAHAPRAPAPARSRLGRWFIYGGAAAVAAGVGIYLLDEDPVTQPGVPVPQYYQDTAPAGIAVGAIGIASIGFGIWWSLRTSSSVMPTLSVGPSHATVGLVCRL